MFHSGHRVLYTSGRAPCSVMRFSSDVSMLTVQDLSIDDGGMLNYRLLRYQGPASSAGLGCALLLSDLCWMRICLLQLLAELLLITNL